MRNRYFMQPPNAEFLDRERQAPPDLVDRSGSVAGAKEVAVRKAKLGEPRIDFDVRCTYDSRPVNGYDFNLTSVILAHAPLNLQFVVPNGYRAVPRKWRIIFDPVPVASPQDIVFFPQANNADVPNNSVLVGSGTSGPIETFFLVEENATFGARIVDVGGVITGNIYLEVYGNLLPVTGVALPFEASNRKI